MVNSKDPCLLPCFGYNTHLVCQNKDHTNYQLLLDYIYIYIFVCVCVYNYFNPAEKCTRFSWNIIDVFIPGCSVIL